jgi:hypothetical protein
VNCASNACVKFSLYTVACVDLCARNCNAGVNKRCETDPGQQARVNQMLNMHMHSPITESLLAGYQRINTDTVDAGAVSHDLLSAVLLVCDNQARSSFNRNRAPIDAELRGTVVIGWRLPLQVALRALSTVQQDTLYEIAPELTVFFVAGAPAMQLENRNTSLHLSNGQLGEMHSLTLDAVTHRFVRERMASASAGDVIMLPNGTLPQFINVTFKVSARDFSRYWKQEQYLQAVPHLCADGDTISHYSVTVPFPAVVSMTEASEEIKSIKSGKGKTAQRFYSCKPYVDLAFAITYWKCQVTCSCFVCNLYHDFV